MLNQGVGISSGSTILVPSPLTEVAPKNPAAGCATGPVVYTNNRRAILALEKGNPGERAFTDAFKAWGQ
jgi:hypothetical protein